MLIAILVFLILLTFILFICMAALSNISQNQKDHHKEMIAVEKEKLKAFEALVTNIEWAKIIGGNSGRI